MNTTTQTTASLEAELAALRAENTALKNSKPSGGIKIGKSGGVSVYGLGRFPVTLYASQWANLAEMIPSVMEFIEANRPNLKTKE